jgi:peptidyl-prolyl cis-trans isomerase D
MISWIQHHLIRHGRWIFLSLLALIIVAFVFTIGNTPGCTTDSSGYRENLFYGIDLNAPREREVIIEKVQLSAFLNGQQIRSDEQFQTQLTNRIALLHLADEIGVPSPDQAVLRDYITTKNAFRGADGEFSADAYTAFIDNIESNPRTRQGLVLIVLEEDFRINQIGSVISGPGYLLPSEALAQTQRNRTELTLATAQLNYAEFTPEIAEEEAALREYYEANKLRYEIPERIEASYVFFDLTSYEGQVPEVSEAELREHFIANRAQFVADFEAAKPAPASPEPVEVAEGEEAPESPEPAEAASPEPAEAASPEPAEAVTFNDVREAVAQSYLAEQESRIANQAAQSFAYSLYRDEIKLDSAAFNTLLNESSLSLTKIEPYTLAGASQRALSPDLLESAFQLGGNRYYSDAYAIDGGFAVLIYEGRIAPEIPEFEAVQVEVTSDFKADEKRRLFNEKGESLQAELKAKIGEGSAFSEAAEALGLTAQSYETFSAQDAPRELNRSALQQAQGMQSGEVSPMLTSEGTGIFVYVKNKMIPEIASDDEDLTQAEDYLARFAAYTSGTAFANELVFRGLPEDATEELAE